MFSTHAVMPLKSQNTRTLRCENSSNKNIYNVTKVTKIENYNPDFVALK